MTESLPSRHHIGGAAADGSGVSPLFLFAAWSVVSIPAALAVGALLSVVARRQEEEAAVPVAVRARSDR
jgi:hypothetical protein